MLAVLYNATIKWNVQIRHVGKMQNFSFKRNGTYSNY